MLDFDLIILTRRAREGQRSSTIPLRTSLFPSSRFEEQPIQISIHPLAFMGLKKCRAHNITRWNQTSYDASGPSTFIRSASYRTKPSVQDSTWTAQEIRIDRFSEWLLYTLLLMYAFIVNIISLSSSLGFVHIRKVRLIFSLFQASFRRSLTCGLPRLEWQIDPALGGTS